MKQHT